MSENNICLQYKRDSAEGFIWITNVSIFQIIYRSMAFKLVSNKTTNLLQSNTAQLFQLFYF